MWQLIIELGRDANGKRRWKYESVRGTKGHAKKVLRPRLNELEAGTHVEPTDLSVAEFLRSWHSDHARHHLCAHAHATRLLKGGVHPKVVSERLGHASIGITLDTYSHVMPGMQEEEEIDAGLRAALAG